MNTLKRAKQPMPDFVVKTLRENRLGQTYASRPPYQRNDYLSWINRAVRDATKQKRLNQMLDELRAGDCYMGMAWGGNK
ncbi:YdeI/OmpD-associated family protein [Profundibacter sp.]